LQLLIYNRNSGFIALRKYYRTLALLQCDLMSRKPLLLDAAFPPERNFKLGTLAIQLKSSYNFMTKINTYSARKLKFHW